jgi:hypothetical protein
VLNKNMVKINVTYDQILATLRDWLRGKDASFARETIARLSEATTSDDVEVKARAMFELLGFLSATRSLAGILEDPRDKCA